VPRSRAPTSPARRSVSALARGELTDYRLAHSARADLCRRLGHAANARAAYEWALSLTQQEPERRFLQEI
jgi:RNA polymerase sigma-70 factor (ECF subfamily)